MRIVWSSNAPWVRSGYGVQTRLFAPRLHTQLGHDVALVCWCGLGGGTLVWNELPCYPTMDGDQFGWRASLAASGHYKADLMITLIDAWVYDTRMLGPIKWAPWFPVDSEPIPPGVLNAAKNCYAPIIFSKFAEAQLRDAGVECEYVPHGVETGVFQRKPMAEARAAIGLPGDRFIVGMVAANRGIPSRKAFPECIRAFSEFHTKHPEAYLYLHADQAPPGGINLPELCDIYGLRGSVSFVDGYTNHLGLDDGFMVNVFNSMDVLLSPSYGEGFGVPILEAQACGTPVIVGDWTAMPELCRYGWKIDREDATPYYNFEASYQFMPKVGAIVEALEAAFAAGKQHESSVDAEAWARTNYDADVVTRDYWGPALERIHQRQLCGAGELKLVNLG